MSENNILKKEDKEVSIELLLPIIKIIMTLVPCICIWIILGGIK